MKFYTKPTHRFWSLSLMGLLLVTSLEEVKGMEVETNPSYLISNESSECAWALNETDYATFRQSYESNPLATQEKLRTLKTLSINNAPLFNADHFIEIAPYLSNMTSLTLMGVRLEKDLSSEMEQYFTSLKFLKLSVFDPINARSFRNIKTLDTLYLFADSDQFFSQKSDKIEDSESDESNESDSGSNIKWDSDVSNEHMVIEDFGTGITYNFIRTLTIDYPFNFILSMKVKDCANLDFHLQNFLKDCEPFFKSFPNLEEFEFTKVGEIDWARILWMQASFALSKVAHFSFEDFINNESFKEVLESIKENPPMISFNLLTQVQNLKTSYPHLKLIRGDYINPTISF